MGYNFVKIKDNRTGLKYPWILECKDLITLVEHTDKCMGHTIKEGVQDWFKKQSKFQHFTTDWAFTCDNFAKMRGENFIMASTRLENEVWAGKVSQLFKGRTLYLREIGSYMIDSPNFQITDRLVSDTLVYPGYTKEDIKITKWDGGTHYYAKIGKMDVIDREGNQKWNSRWEAQQAAEEELHNL